MDIDDDGEALTEESGILISSGDIAPEEQRVAYVNIHLSLQTWHQVSVHTSEVQRPTCDEKIETEGSAQRNALGKSERDWEEGVEELLSDMVPELPIPAVSEIMEEASESATSIFLRLSDKIGSAKTKNKDASRGLIYSYFDFGEAVFKRYKELKLKHGKDGSQALVKSETLKQIINLGFSLILRNFDESGPGDKIIRLIRVMCFIPVTTAKFGRNYKTDMFANPARIIKTDGLQIWPELS
ncbi:hypothetical protein RhiirA4_499431 [Rhizophagus irregularis]|uniref:Uncharacterized protein n=1 Tax=Rhizophagus irregularis TaxID=588596 RepID=A0A2I1H482_9GLOM|nr:hypothetical protein RhiirA4_499431 [Rhizophagus irregularis]